MKIKYLPLLFLTLLTAACLSTPASQEKEEVTLPVQTEPVQKITAIKELPSWVFDSTPVDGKPRIVVFTEKISDEEKAQIVAGQMAALDAVKMEGVYVSAKTLAQEGDYNFGFAANVKIDYLKERAPDYLDKLELDKILHTKMGTVARFLYNGMSTSFTYDLTENSDGPPVWISSQPNIDGYTIAIGSADRHRSWGNSFAAADENALANLAVTLHGKLKSIKDMNESNRNDNSQLAMLETIFISGEGIMKDAMIIARWADNNEKQFYSLAVIPTPDGLK